MSNSVDAIREEPKGSVDPARVLEKAYSSTKAKGSSTACIIALTDQVTFIFMPSSLDYYKNFDFDSLACRLQCFKAKAF
jgi:hypothetical protein